MEIYMLATYELPGDHRYKADVEKAVKVPKPEGYDDGEIFYITATVCSITPSG